MLTIACVLRSNGSEIYNPEWVYKLKRAIERNLSIPHKFVCLTDVPLDCDYVMLTSGAVGWWSKLQLFKNREFNEETLYFDLDVIISKPLDEFVSKLRSMPYNFLMTKEQPIDLPNSSVMYWTGSHSYLYRKYKIDPEKYHHRYRKRYLIGDQAFIAEHGENIGFLNECCSNDFMLWTKDLDFTATTNTGMLLFLGSKAKPHLIPTHPFITEHWK